MNSYPKFIYGTAWKKEQTEVLVNLALEAGFRAFDTANQPKHYNEPALGEALRQFLAKGHSRDSLWIQTKFTPLDGHDSRVPYDGKASIPQQVQQSFESSLEHLGVEYVDSYLLHGPYNYPLLGQQDWEAWKAMEEIQKKGGARQIGISNVNPLQLKLLLDEAPTRPASVQNRCFANRAWDIEVRGLCVENQIHYQGFSLLTANPQVLASPLMKQLCKQFQMQPAQVIFRFAQQMGMTPLTGTSQPAHMALDLESHRFELTQEALLALEESFVKFDTV